jgi:Carbohydrate family 9 binding domain-like
MHRIFIAGTLCAATFWQSASTRPRYEVRRAKHPIVVDGKIEKKEWAAASPPIELIFPWDSQTGPKQKTHVRLLWDDQNLYIAYECDDTDIAAQVQGRDEFVYRDDTVELFLNVKPSQKLAYYCLEINARGTVMDYVCIDSQYYMRRFDFHGLQVGIQVNGTMNMRGDRDNGWTLEMAIPWKNFADMAEPPQVGTLYTANINRWDGTEPDRRLSVWADSKLSWPHPHAPENFGELVFTK